MNWDESPFRSSVTRNARISRVSWFIMTLSLMNPRAFLCLWCIQSLRVAGASPVASGIRQRTSLPFLTVVMLPFCRISMAFIFRHRVTWSGASSSPRADSAMPWHMRYGRGP